MDSDRSPSGAEELAYIEQLTERILDNLKERGINPLLALSFAHYVLEEME